MDNVDKDDRNVTDKSSSENSPRNSVDNQDGDEKIVSRKSSSENSPRNSVDEKNVSDNSSSENSPRSSIDKQNEEDGQNEAREPSLENSPKGTLDNQEKEEYSPRGSVDNQEKDVAHETSLGSSPRDMVNAQDGDENNVTIESSVESSPREKDVAHESSLEISSRDILDNQDEDDKNVSHKSSSDSSPIEVSDNQEHDEINETHKSSPESSPRGTLEQQDEDEKNVAHKSSSEDSPRGTHDNQDEDGKNLTHKSSSEDSQRGTNDNQEKDENHVFDKSISENFPRNTHDNQDEDEKHVSLESDLENSRRNALDDQEKDEDHVTHKSSLENSPRDILDTEVGDKKNDIHKSTPEDPPRNTNEVQVKDKEELECKMEMLKISKDSPKNQNESERECMDDTGGPSSDTPNDINETAEEGIDQEEADPVFDGTEAPELKGSRSSSSRSLDSDSEAPAPALSEKAVAIKNFVRGGSVAVSSLIRRLSCKKDDYNPPDEEEMKANVEEGSSPHSKQKEVSEKAGGATWNPLNYIKIGRDTDIQNKPEQTEDASVENPVAMPVMKGTIIVYTRLGCQECKQVRLFMHQKRLKYVEINIDIYPTRKLELEKNTGSCVVPRVYFNDFLVGGLSELKAMDESGKLDEKIDYVMKEEPSSAAPLPPLSGEDDETGCGKIDELASIVRKMKETIVLRDKFCKMRKFTNCFLGSDAVDFLSEDQYLEREAAVEFGRKLASKHFFRHILDENIFEDGNHLYRFLEHDPIVLTQCYNISWGTIDVKPKPITEIASRLRFLCFAMFEAYVSEDGRHVDYRSIHSSEEFQRYLRIVEELQRVDLDGSSREEKLAFFINLYNMMAIHAILTWGYPVGVMDRRRFLGDFKYVVGGCTYSLSAIQNGILRGNQRPPYNLMKPFGPKDKRFKVALPFTEPLVHFALVCGTRSGPALRCFSPGNIDKELMEAAHDFMRNGGLVVDIEAKVASVSRILWWYSMDFGKTELEVLKHAANYLEADKSEELLELVANTQLKVAYQPYDWSLNC